MALLVSLSVGAFLLTDASLPHGQSGPEADALARKIEHAVNIAAWQRTGAVRWTFADRHHLWDRQRALARLQCEAGGFGSKAFFVFFGWSRLSFF